MTPRQPMLELVCDDRPANKVRGSLRFIRLTRNPGLKSPARFQATVKRAGDIII